MGAYLAIKSKNLLPYPFGDKGIVTRNGITFTDNGDGSITVNGTATAEAYFALSYKEFLTTSPNQMVACYTGNPVGASTDTYYIYLPQTGHKITKSYHLSGNPSYWKSIRIIVKSGVTVNNAVFRPMVYVYDSSKGYDTNYEPYYTYKRVKALTVSGNKFDINGAHTKNTPNIRVINGNELFCHAISGSADYYIKYSAIYPKGTYKFSANIKKVDSTGNVVSDTKLRIVTSSQITGGTWNNFYKGYFKDLESGEVFTFTANEDFTIMFPWTGGAGLNSTMSNITLRRIGAKCTIRMRPTAFPEQYQRVEYIESTGTQYIDTGVIGKSGLTAEMKMCWTALQKDGAFLGSRTDVGGAKRIYMCYMYNPNFATEQVGRWYIGYNALKDTGISIEKDRVYELKTILKNAKQEFYIDGERVWYEYVGGEVNTGLNLYLFNYNADNSIVSHCASSARLYYLKIYDGDKLVRNFIPCYRKSDGKIGLLDIVSGVFFTNPQGTGTFRKGADV